MNLLRIAPLIIILTASTVAAHDKPLKLAEVIDIQDFFGEQISLAPLKNAVGSNVKWMTAKEKNRNLVGLVAVEKVLTAHGHFTAAICFDTGSNMVRTIILLRAMPDEIAGLERLMTGTAWWDMPPPDSTSDSAKKLYKSVKRAEAELAERLHGKSR